MFLVLIAGGTSAARSTRRLIWVGLDRPRDLDGRGGDAAGTVRGGRGHRRRGQVDGRARRPAHALRPRHRGPAAAARRRRSRCCSSCASIDRRSTAAGLVDRRRLRSSRSCSRARRATRATPRPATFTIFAVPLDTLHVLAMSIWLGGLVVLLVAALGGGFSGGLRQALSTFSRARVLVRRGARPERRLRVVAPGRVPDPRLHRHELRPPPADQARHRRACWSRSPR